MYGIVAAVVALVHPTVQLKLKHNKTYMSELSIKTRGNELLSICFSSSFNFVGNCFRNELGNLQNQLIRFICRRMSAVCSFAGYCRRYWTDDLQ